MLPHENCLNFNRSDNVQCSKNSVQKFIMWLKSSGLDCPVADSMTL